MTTTIGQLSYQTLNELLGELVYEISDEAVELAAYWQGHAFNEQADEILGRLRSKVQVLAHIRDALRREAELLDSGRQPL